MSIKQISVFLENKAGSMLELTRTLAEKGIDMRALSLAEASDFGIVRLITKDVFEASTVLKEAGFIYSITPVIGVCIPDEAGGLNKVLETLNDAFINVEYMYAFLGNISANEAYMIFHVQDPKAASSALRARGVKLLDQEDIEKL